MKLMFNEAYLIQDVNKLSKICDEIIPVTINSNIIFELLEGKNVVVLGESMYSQLIGAICLSDLQSFHIGKNKRL